MPSHTSPFQRSIDLPEVPLPDPQNVIRQQEVVQLLKQVIEPTLQTDIVSLGMVRNLRIVEDYIYLRLYAGVHQHDLQSQIQDILSRIIWCKKTYVQLCTIPNVKTTLAISSGKGGVGKSTTAVNLAVALSLQGAKVGLLDADIYGPNVPQMLGLGQSAVQVIDTPQGQRFLPLESHGIKVMSVGLLAEPDHPLAWRGPVLHKIITQFIHEVEWGELDYLLIDLPPGTGDAQITIVQESPICGVMLVTTPQQVAIADVRRSIHMFRRVGVPVLGVIENMSYLCDQSGNQTPIFGSGGGQQLATELQAPLLGQVPIDPRICNGGDTGVPLTLSDSASAVAQVFTKIAVSLTATFQPTHWSCSMLIEKIALQSHQQLQSSTLWQQIQDRSIHALNCGAIQPVTLHCEWIEQAGMGFWAQVMPNLVRRDTAQQTANPFLPYETDLFVTHLSDTHLCLLNKFNIVDHHVLIVTRSFEKQEAPLTLKNFEAVGICLAELNGLVFYNSGKLAGSSQSHRHLQMIPLPFASSSELPIESIIAQAQFRDGIGTVSAFPFLHAIIRLGVDWSNSPAAAQSMLVNYHRLLNAVHLSYQDEYANIFHLNAHNLLITREWMLIIPRIQPYFESISINALGFAGIVLVKEESQLQRIKKSGLISILKSVSFAH